MSADASHITEPDPTGASPARAMRMAIDDAGIDPTEVGYVNAHATSTPLGDSAETKVIKIALGEEHARRTPISSTKGATGHMLRRRRRDRGDLHACSRSATGSLPPTINSRTPDPDCDLDYVPNVAREVPELKVAVSNSFGFGGHNATIVFAAGRLARIAAMTAVGDIRLLRDADRLERRDPRPSSRGCFGEEPSRRAARALPRARAGARARRQAAPTAR